MVTTQPTQVGPNRRGGAPTSPAMRTARRRRRGRLRGRWAPYLYIAPFLVSFVLFFALPSVLSLLLSFARDNGYTPARWVGLANYRALLSSPEFRQAALNTLFYWLVPMVPLMAGAFGLAMAVRSRLARWASVCKPLIFIPQVIAPVSAALVWRVMLSNQGVLNALFGLRTGWLEDPAAVKWSVAMLLVWRGIGWYFVVFLAGLTNVPETLLEAASIDGANAFQRLRHVIMPLMRPTILFAIVIDTIASIQLFTEPNLLLGGTTSTAGAPPEAAPLMNQIVNGITGGQFGLAAAAAWLMFLVIAVFSLIQFRLLREER